MVQMYEPCTRLILVLMMGELYLLWRANQKPIFGPKKCVQKISEHCIIKGYPKFYSPGRRDSYWLVHHTKKDSQTSHNVSEYCSYLRFI